MLLLIGQWDLLHASRGCHTKILHRDDYKLLKNKKNCIFHFTFRHGCDTQLILHLNVCDKIKAPVNNL